MSAPAGPDSGPHNAATGGGTGPPGASATTTGLLAVLTAVVMAPALVAAILVLVVAAVAGAAAQCAQPQAGVTAVAGPVRIPVAGRYVVTSEFGTRVHPVTGQRRAHQGLDLASIPSGGPVVAATAGTVVSARAEGDAGNTVTLEHGGGLTTRYLHLRDFTVATGQVVVTGQQVGVEGTTGVSTGEHLHFEVRQDGQPLSPRAWLQDAGVDVDTGHGPPPAQPEPSPAALGRRPPSLGQPNTPGPTLRQIPLPVVGDVPADVAGYRGEQLVNAAVIIGVGQDMGLDVWTTTVAVMTAMGESSLRNLDRGDAAGPDSRGLFQQRDNGAWGSYADRTDPATATRNFFTALQRVPGYRDLAPTLAAHRTQRNADDQHYARHWPAAVQVTAVLTADPTLVNRLADTTTPAQCTPASGELTPPGAPGGPAPAEPVLAAAASLTGIPYRWGGSTPAAFDCSGYTQYVYAQVGVQIPRTAASQQAATTPVTQPQPGDLVFFATPPPTSASTPAARPTATTRCTTHPAQAPSPACTTSGATTTSTSVGSWRQGPMASVLGGVMLSKNEIDSGQQPHS